MVQTAVTIDGAGDEAARYESAASAWLTGRSAIALAYSEGQAVTLLPGAQVGGLTTRCAQPGKVVHIQYGDEFGVTYVVAFGKLGMYAYVSAEGLEAEAEVEAQQVAPQRAERLPLATPVLLCNGVSAIISAYSTADCHSYRVSWFDRRTWSIRHKWTDRQNFEVITGAASSATDAAAAVTLSA